MKLTELCIRRPVLCTVLWLIPVFIGLLISKNYRCVIRLNLLNQK